MLTLSHVSKFYASGRQRTAALQGVSLEVAEGEFIALMGPSGAGKSTLLHIMGGLDQPSDGSVHFMNKNVGTMNDAELSRFRHEHVGFIFQDALLLPQLTVLENVLVPGMFQNATSDASFEATAKKLLEDVGLSQRLRHSPHELSGGEKQRACIARALMMNPELILADEPTGNLDEKTGQEILKLFKKFHEQRKTTFVIATHDKEIAKISHRVIEITEGKIDGK